MINFCFIEIFYLRSIDQNHNATKPLVFSGKKKQTRKPLNVYQINLRDADADSNTKISKFKPGDAIKKCSIFYQSFLNFLS